MARTLRYLRIVFSVTCGIACVLLVVLWVRSYWRLDAVRTASHSATSFLGWLMIDKGYVIESLSHEFSPHLNNRVGVSSFPVNEIDVTPLPNGGVSIPFWAPTLLFAALPLMLWLRWRFTLRTLLITTTLIAVVLGLIVYAAR